MSNNEKNDWEFNHLEIKKDLENHITTIIMDHPPLSNLDTRTNTMGPALVEELRKVQDLLYNDLDARIIILKGSKHYFSGGGDFGGGEPQPPGTPIDIRAWAIKKGVVRGQRIFKRFREIHIPVIAAIEGMATGGGLELAMSCDLRYAREDAMMGLFETTYGMIPGWGGTQLMVRHVGVGRAMELILKGEVISAQRAYEIGLINGVFKIDEFDDKVHEEAKEIVQKCTPVGIGIAKQMINFGSDVPLDIGLELEAYGYGTVANSKDFLIGLTTGGDGRKPNYLNE
ncbi:MAG: enoyl-CoA hydratase/isomerase family protein [Promethearchaeota archaeon]|jgi:enoyl-CoA hydratase/3-hydroxyacyl-CoA dehydrogenase